MRRWHKYSLAEEKESTPCLLIDTDFIQHAKAMGGYAADESYNNKKSFFEKYFYNYHGDRLICYDKFIEVV